MKTEKTLSELQNDSHQQAVKSDWWVSPPSPPESFCLMHSEISEALEQFRIGKGLKEIYIQNGKPEGIPVELADCVIRIMDFCGFHGIDLAEAIAIKSAYNATRTKRHGGKKI